MPLFKPCFCFRVSKGIARWTSDFTPPVSEYTYGGGDAVFAGTVTAAAFQGEGIVPSGVIVMWSGSLNSIPSGWVLCDGINGTPDLRDRFIVGARQDEDDIAKTNVTDSLTQTGGSSYHDLSHSHGAGNYTAANHTHTTGRHQNGYQYGEGVPNYDPNEYTGESSSLSISGTSASTGSTTQSILPPYFALAYIMKL